MAVSTSIKLKFDGAAVKRGLESIRSGIAKLNKSGGTWLSNMISKTAKWGALLGSGVIAKIGFDAVNAASDMETLQTQFAALLKSGNAATQFIEKLRKLNVESPLGLDDFAKGGKVLLGVEMSAESAADALDKLSNISMGNSDNFDSLVRAFSQVKSAGRLMGQEVLQFVNAGFNPLPTIAKRTGESMAQLKKRMEDGAVSFDEVKRAISDATGAGGLFNGMNQKIAATTEGKINKLKDSWNQLLIAFGTPVNDHLRPMIDALNDKFSKFNKSASEIGEKTGQALTMISNAFSNGEVGNVIKDTFMFAVKMAGAELMALATTAGELFAQAAKGNIGKGIVKWLEDINPIRRASEAVGFDAKRGSQSEFFKTEYNMGSHQQNRDAAYQLVGVDAAKQAFEETLKRNQTPLIDMSISSNRPKELAPGQAAEYMRQAVEELKGVNRKLSPQP